MVLIELVFMRTLITIICLLGLIDNAHSQTQETDSVKKIVALDEVIVTGQNITRIDDHLLIIPNKQQREHVSTAYGLLKSLMIPGLSVNAKENKVDAMGMEATLYVNGVESEAKDIKMLRPRDISKIEYYDAPTGKYAKDKIAINFITIQYKYGGYVQLDGLQTIGYTHGDYNFAGSLNKGDFFYSLFVGTDYEKFGKYNTKVGDEQYTLTNNTINRFIESKTDSRDNNKYVQLRTQYQKNGKYVVGKLSFISNSVPQACTNGWITSKDVTSNFCSFVKQENYAPKLDITGNIPITKTKSLTFGVHGKYIHNTYDRAYEEQSFSTNINEVEDVGNFQLSAIYSSQFRKKSFTAELFHYHNIWNANYTSIASLWQHLWQCESLAFVSYNYRLSSRFSLRYRLGLDWLQYRLHGNDRFSQLSPRLNINVQYRHNTRMLLYSFNYMNSNHGMEVVNDAEVSVNSYMTAKGNPCLKKSHDINTYIYYSENLKKVRLTFMGQYRMNHNPVMNDYLTSGNYIIKTFTNDGNVHYFSLIAATTYQPNKNISLSGDIRYSHTHIDAGLEKYCNNITGNLSMSLYAGRFSFSPYLNFNKKTLDISSLVLKNIPLDYGLNSSYAIKDFLVEVLVASPFTKRKNHIILDTSCYAYNFHTQNRTDSQYCNIKVTYTLDFGRKTNKVKRNIDNEINSSLLRVA